MKPYLQGRAFRCQDHEVNNIRKEDGCHFEKFWKDFFTILELIHDTSAQANNKWNSTLLQSSLDLLNDVNVLKKSLIHTFTQMYIQTWIFPCRHESMYCISI